EETAAPGTAIDEDTLLDLLDEALQAGVLTEEGSGSRILYAFWHPLLVSHLYERLSATRRMRLHRRAAEVLQRLSVKQDEVAATITHHLVQGGTDPVHIIHYARLAGHRAYGLSAYPEAERQYRLLAEHINLLDSEEAPVLLERLAECASVQGNFEEARTLYERSLKMRVQQVTAPPLAHVHDE